MATISHQFTPEDAVMPSSGYAPYQIKYGTGTPANVTSSLLFDAATDEAVFFKFCALGYPGSGNLTLDLYWYADTATTGDVVWEAAIAAITPNTDSQDVETDAMATSNTITDSHHETVGQRLHLASITISNLDSLAAGDIVWLRINRDANNASDTMTGDAQLVLAVLSYSDT